MRILLLCAALLLAVPSAGIADDTTSDTTDASAAVTDNGAAVTGTADSSQDGDVSRNEGAWQGEGGARQHHHQHGSQSGGSSQSSATCVQGFQTATCGDFTGCALPTWQCCPNSSNGGWQWADNSSACPI